MDEDNQRCIGEYNPDNYIAGTIVEIGGEFHKVIRGLDLKKYFEAGHSSHETSRYDPIADKREELTSSILRRMLPKNP